MQAASSFRSDSARRVAGRLLLAVLDVLAGGVALVWPGITALALALLVAAWALVTGICEVVLVFGAGKTAGERALLGLTGLVSVALGVVFAIRPELGAVTIAEVFGLFSIISGVAALVMAANLRRARPVSSTAAATV